MVICILQLHNHSILKLTSESPINGKDIEGGRKGGGEGGGLPDLDVGREFAGVLMKCYNADVCLKLKIGDKNVEQKSSYCCLHRQPDRSMRHRNGIEKLLYLFPE